jgi:hypothetical protein
MSLSPKTSSRFQRAAAAERGRLLSQREKLATEVKRRQEALAEVEAALAAITERIHALEALSEEDAGPEPEPTPAETPPIARGEAHSLRGAAIREMAVRVLISANAEQRPIHYRDWLTLLGEFGFRVEGKRPEAVFLNQLVRSPLVRATTKAGIYQLDREVTDQLRARLAGLQRELSELISEPIEDGTLLASTARHEELTREIRSTGKALEETRRSLTPLRDRAGIQLAA